MKYLIATFLALTIFSCSNAKKISKENDTLYKVKKIEKINSWYVIYVIRQDTLSKIISKSDTIIGKNCSVIEVGKSYRFTLKSHKENAPTINNVKLDPVGYVGCYQFDSETSICLEPENGIFDLFITANLKGMCYTK